MFRSFKSKIGLATFYVFVAIALEIALFVRLDLGILPKYWAYDLSIILIIAGIIFIVPNYIIQAIITAVMTGLQILLFYLNFTLYHLYGDVFSLDMINLFNEAAKAVTSDFSYIWVIVALAIAYILILTGIVFIARQRRRYPLSFRRHFSIAVVMVLLIIQGLGSSLFVSQRNSIKATGNIVEADRINDAFLMDTSMLKIASLETFGTFGYYVNNLLNTLWEDEGNDIIDDAIMYFNDVDVHDENDSELFGVDEGNNVIMIMMESMEWFGFCDGTYNSRTFSAELTPNIYALINEGFIAEQFFAKAKTNISEGIGFMGSYSIGKYMAQVTANTSENQYGFSLPSVLSDNGYATTYFHTNESTYYERNKTHTKLGFDDIYCPDHEELGLDSDCKWGHWLKEEDFVYAAMEYMIPEGANKNIYGNDAEKFFSFYTTVSSHGPYDNNSNNADQVEYKDYVMYGETADLQGDARKYTSWYTNVLEAYGNKGKEFINRLVNYQATIIGLDKAIGAIVKQLKDYNIYDDTTIILYSDHDAYYHNMAGELKGVSSDEYMNIGLNTIPLIIKSSGIANTLNDKGERLVSTDRFCSAYDLVPTVLDLLGIKFNKKLYVGNSLFAPIEDVVIGPNGEVEEVVVYYSLTGGLINNKVYTLNMRDFHKCDDFVTVAYMDKFTEVSAKTLTKLNYICLLYVYGVYEHVIPV